jgi:hypothetical protein
MSMRRWLIIAAAFWFTFVVNPGYFVGCGSAEPPGFSFGEAEMLKLLESANQAEPIAFSSAGSDYTLEFRLIQRSGMDRDDTASRARPAMALQAYACGTRTFLQSAAACITLTELPVVGSVILRKRAADGPGTLPAELEVTGALRVSGYDLRQASLDLNDQVDTISLHSVDGQTFELEVFDAPKLGDGGGDISFTKP